VNKKKNILFITTDQQHWSAMGCMNPELKTPNIDRLAEQGMLFTRAYTVNPTCTPTRATLITGLYPSQHGAYSLGTKLMENVPTLGDEFQKHGYRTALIGKAHFQPLKGTEEFPSLESYPIIHDLDFWKEFHGPFYGFDHVELCRNHTDEAHVGQHYALWMEERAPGSWRQYFLPTPERFKEAEDFPVSSRQALDPGEGVWDIPEELHYNTWIAERTNAQMDQYARNGENFFLWASFFDPHPQYMVPEPYASMYNPSEVTVPVFREGEFDDKPAYFKLSREERPDGSAFQETGGHAVHGMHSHLRKDEVKAKNIATMYGMMTMLDKYIGQIVDHLDELGLAEDTLICLTTDHGDFMGQHGLIAKAIHHYEDLLKIPLVVRMPGTVPAGIRSDSLQSLVDLPQTFLHIAGLPVPRTMAGIDETAVFTGESHTIRDHVIVENRHQPTTMNIRTYINERYKISIHYNRSYGELYDLKNDPDEYVNLWDIPAHQDLKYELLLKFLYGEMKKEPMPMPRIFAA
jgi:uncharacterized sulfatase